MDTSGLKTFAQEARRALRAQVSSKLDLALAIGAAARREAPKAVEELEREIANTSRDHVVEKVAYTWFNRLSALRFMDANGYTGTRVVSPAEGQTRPEILSEAMAGVIGDEVPAATRDRVRALLDGRSPSSDPQGEPYRLLLVALCNHWHGAMPFMFEKIADYTELLMPDDLLSASSVAGKMRAVMTDTACQDVEIIGWLYQFYISERKEEIDRKVKGGGKVLPAELPPKTALFTPHWIVRYLVENSLGRLWLLNRPNSRLRERMDYYIAPEVPDTNFLRITSPEEIKVCDPACGSGHMLTYAFDLLHAIYEEEGYDAVEIPGLILNYNLYGIEIDARAGALSAFALTMKAVARQKRLLRRDLRPRVCVLESVGFEAGELHNYMDAIGRDLLTIPVVSMLKQFSEAGNFGSLIQPVLTDVTGVRKTIESKNVDGNLFLHGIHARAQAVLRMADYLAPKYHIVVANPPYLGRGSMNPQLMNWSEENYLDAKADLFAMFMVRALNLTTAGGFTAMINMQSWMFLSSYEQLRKFILNRSVIVSMAHLGERAFDTIGGSVVSTTAFVLAAQQGRKFRGDFVRLVDGRSEAEKVIALQGALDGDCSLRFRASAEDFDRIPGAPIAYWISTAEAEAFKGPKLSSLGDTRRGLQTGNKDRFIRQWNEPSFANVEWCAGDRNMSLESDKRWFRFNNGGEYRKWAGGFDLLVNWKNGGIDIKKAGNSIVPSEDRYFQEAICWSRISSGPEGYRYHPAGILPGDLSPCFFSNFPLFALAYFNTPVSRAFKSIVNPTITNTVGDLAKIPAPERAECWRTKIELIAKHLVNGYQADWDTYETSWAFSVLPLISPSHRRATIAETYAELRAHWRSTVDDMRRAEEENNRIFINAYGLQDELSDEVRPEEITLTCNPAYRYGGKKKEAELEDMLRADTIREFLSYAVGCMFGRYSLDAPGLILASEGEGRAHYLAKVPKPTFEPDADNVIPMLDGDWFPEDIIERFRKFLCVTFGEEHFQENLAFVEEALGKDVQKYFLRDFFNDHVKRYKNRPIYWLFSSPQRSFNAFIYMHRYRPDTVSVLLNDYLRAFRSMLETQKAAQDRVSISADATAGQRTAAMKDVQAITKQIDEVDAWEREVIYPMATRRIEIDLDVGVKANYPKFAGAVKPIKGLEQADD